MAQNIIINGVSYNGVSSISIPTSDGGNAQYIDASTVGFLPNYNWSEDLIATSIDTDGSIYEGIGYKLGYRLNSSGGETAMANSIITGYIPYEQGDIFLVKAKTYIYSMQYQVACDSNFAHLGIIWGTKRAQTAMLHEGNLIYQYAAPPIDMAKVKYVRFSIQDYTNYPFTIHKAI